MFNANGTVYCSPESVGRGVQTNWDMFSRTLQARTPTCASSAARRDSVSLWGRTPWLENMTWKHHRRAPWEQPGKPWRALWFFFFPRATMAPWPDVSCFPHISGIFCVPILMLGGAHTTKGGYGELMIQPIILLQYFAHCTLTRNSTLFESQPACLETLDGFTLWGVQVELLEPLDQGMELQS